MNYENFFYNDEFYTDMDSFLLEIEAETVEELNNNHPDNSEWKFEFSKLEKVGDFDPTEISQYLADKFYDDNYERFPDDSNEKIAEIINKCIDWDRLNGHMPKYYYPNGEFETITFDDIYKYLE
jgi:hypothetical protein